MTQWTDPKLREAAKAEAVRRLGGRHSARAMQFAGAIYRAAGGGYRGPRTAAQRSLAKWTDERWTTFTGKKACKKSRCDRYLPEAAWLMLTPAEVAATRKKKLASSSQYVDNAPAAREVSKAARKARPRR
jgi:hypothetical protein